jgi:hypothetical protein
MNSAQPTKRSTILRVAMMGVMLIDSAVIAFAVWVAREE